MLAATGCGSSATAPAASVNPADASPPANSTAASTVPKKSGVDSQREAFTKGCMENMQAPEYCDCGFTQFAQIFKDADFSEEPPKEDPRMVELAARIKGHCSDKFPEAKAKEHFLLGCVEDDAKKEPYCNCAWTELRNTLSVEDILTYEPPGSAKWSEAKKAIPKACKGKYPAELANSDYMNTCKKDSQSTDKQCQCRWKKLAKKFSIEEIVAGTAEPSQIPDLAKCK